LSTDGNIQGAPRQAKLAYDRPVQASKKARLKPVQRDRLADQAHAAIRSAIVKGDFAMGERLVETQLAGDLQMSRAPVREALQRLAKEGLVTEHPHHGMFVTIMTAADVVDFCNVRLGIETVAVRLFMRERCAVDPLWAKIDAMEGAAERDDMSAVVRAEFEFHRVICEGSGNALLLRLFAEQEGRLMLVMGLDDANFERLHDVAAEHEPVVRAIESGVPEAAVTAMEEHVLSTVADLIARLGGNDAGLLEPLRYVAKARARTRRSG
jgi:DNA-binding GntR family transcriptional regulator